MQGSLLQSIYALGEEMCLALERDDLDAFFALLAQRTPLIERLATYASPAEVGPDWEKLADALRQQQHRLAGVLAAQEQRLSDALGGLRKQRTARQRYRERPVRARFLHKNLHG